MKNGSGKAQTSIEYLLLLGGVVVVVFAVGILVTNSISAPQPQVHCSFSAFGNLAPVGVNGVNIERPTACEPKNINASPTAQPFAGVGLTIGANVNSVTIRVTDSSDLDLAPPCSMSTNPNTDPNGNVQTVTLDPSCVFKSPGQYRVNVEVTSGGANKKTDTEVGAIIVK